MSKVPPSGRNVLRTFYPLDPTHASDLKGFASSTRTFPQPCAKPD